MALDKLYELIGEADLADAPLIMVLDGWIDAGAGASTALSTMMATAQRQTVAVFDGDFLIDQRARRPIAEITDGRTMGLVWPEIRLEAGHDVSGRPIAFLVGPEPDMHWRGFTQSVVELARELSIDVAVGLGAFPAPAPHTRPVRVAATSPNIELAQQVGVVPGTLSVPAGVHSVLELAFAAAGMSALTLWARVPHYVAGMVFPAAAAALLEALSSLTGLTFDSSDLYAASDVSRQRIEEMLSGSPEHLEMIHQLELHLDAAEGNPLDISEVPSGDDLAAELERYLRGEQ